MKKWILFLGIMISFALFGDNKAEAISFPSRPYTPISYSALPDGNPVYRLYNPNTGEHFYTSSALEKGNLMALGWQDEQIAWYSPFANGKEVYRLYNPNAKGGDHYYTMSIFEKNALVGQGWHYDGAFWQSGGNVSVDAAYNPNAASGAHNFTTSAFEQNKLLALGWKYPSVAWNAV